MSHTGTFVSGHTLVVRRGQYVTARFYLGRGFAGKLVHVLLAKKNAKGHWKAYRVVTSRRLQADGYTCYSAPVGGGGHSGRGTQATQRKGRPLIAGRRPRALAGFAARDPEEGVRGSLHGRRGVSARREHGTAGADQGRSFVNTAGDRARQNLEVVSERPAVEVVEQYQGTGRVPESAARGAENSAWAERRGSEGGFPTRDAAAPRDPVA